MERSASLDLIRNKLFYGQADYTKNQPDLFVPQHFQLVGPSKVRAFIETVRESVTEREILLYIHLPFCFSECLFCNSFPFKADKQVQREYLEYLLRELQLYASLGVLTGKVVKCIYFGGGTPTSFANEDLRRIMDTIRSVVELAPGCSITTEAHPLTLGDERRIGELARIGFTRISTGCQSFDPRVLAFCDRTNTSEQIRRIVKTAQGEGLSINIDMMTGLPGQTIASVRNDMELLGDIRPDAVEYIRHEIINPLILKLYKDRPDLMIDDDTLFEMVYMTQEWMERNGYEQNGRFSDDGQWAYRYYWLHEMPIIACGTRTRSYTRDIGFDKYEDLHTYTRMIDKGIPPVARYIRLTQCERMYRTLILALQLRSGLKIARFREDYGACPLEVFRGPLQTLADYGCLTWDNDAVKLTQHGAYFVEDVCDFLIDAALRETLGDDMVRTSHAGSSRYTNQVQ